MGGREAHAGRPRKPTAVHKRDGTYTEHRHGGRNEPVFSKADMRPPGELDAGAVREWKRLAPELAKLGLLTRADRMVFSVYCQAASDWRAFTKRINAMDDVMFTTSTGYMAITPLVGARNKAWQTLKESSTRFGLDPSSRTHLDVGSTRTDGQTDEEFFYSKPKLET